ncbi:hypothetical protein SPHINGO8AM_30251 [Sphingomonas sp. 8AM]|nr:hypothetical protein SPHINGO8AM_30251 [Sphingomonas sp. 8AM]
MAVPQSAPQRRRQPVDREDCQHRDQEHDQSGEIVREALRCGVAEIISDEDQQDNPHEIGEDRDRDDRQHQQRAVPPVRVVPHVDIEQADRGQADDRVQPRAGRRDQQVILRDLDRHARAADRIPKRVEQVHRLLGDRDLDRLRNDRHRLIGGRKDEAEVQQRKPQFAQHRAAKQQITCAEQRAIKGEALDLDDAGNMGDEVGEQAQRDERTAEHRIAGRAQPQRVRHLAPHQPQPGGQHQWSMAALLGRPADAGDGEHGRDAERDHTNDQQPCGQRQLRPSQRRGAASRRLAVRALPCSDGFVIHLVCFRRAGTILVGTGAPSGLILLDIPEPRCNQRNGATMVALPVAGRRAMAASFSRSGKLSRGMAERRTSAYRRSRRGSAIRGLDYGGDRDDRGSGARRTARDPHRGLRGRGDRRAAHDAHGCRRAR